MTTLLIALVKSFSVIIMMSASTTKKRRKAIQILLEFTLILSSVLGKKVCGELPIPVQLEVYSRCLPLQPLESDVKIYQYPAIGAQGSYLKLCNISWRMACTFVDLLCTVHPSVCTDNAEEADFYFIRYQYLTQVSGSIAKLPPDDYDGMLKTWSEFNETWIYWHRASELNRLNHFMIFPQDRGGELFLALSATKAIDLKGANPDERLFGVLELEGVSGSLMRPDYMPQNLFKEVKADRPDRMVFFLQYNGDTELSLFQPDKDIRLPTLQYCNYGGYNRSDIWFRSPLLPKENLGLGVFEAVPRDILCFWAGRVNHDIHNPSSRHRQILYRTLRDEEGFFILNSRIDPPISQEEYYIRSEFCLNPPGIVGGDSTRYTPAILYGCIPVQYPNTQYLPFHEVIPWSECAVFVEDIADLPEMLRSISPEERELRRKRCFDFAPSLFYSQTADGFYSFIGECGYDDAFHQFISILSARKKKWRQA